MACSAFLYALLKVETVRRDYPNTTRKELAARLGVTQDTLGKLLEREGIRKRPSQHRWPPRNRTLCAANTGTAGSP